MKATIPIAAAGALLIAGGAALGAGSTLINQSSIAGKGTGLAQSAYRGAFGRAQVDRLEGGTVRLNFSSTTTEVYFPRAGGAKADAIVTGNQSYRTAAGIGPCSTYGELKAAYPSLARVPKWGGLLWRNGRLWFRVDDGAGPTSTPADTDVVRVVMLVPRKAPALAGTYAGNSGVTCS